MSQRTPHNDGRSVRQKAFFLAPLVVILSGCAAPPLKTLPADIVGHWTTSEPRYRTRSMALEPEQITFGLGGLEPDKVEQVEAVSMAQRQNETEYVIKLKAADQTPDSVVVQFRPENGGELRLKNQSKVVWTRNRKPIGPVQSMEPPPSMLPQSRYLEHRTLYKIDCLHVDVCHSY